MNIKQSRHDGIPKQGHLYLSVNYYAMCLGSITPNGTQDFVLFCDGCKGIGCE